MTEHRSGQDRRTDQRGGRRADDPIDCLEEHHARWLTIDALSDYWGLHHRTIRKWHMTGLLEGMKVGGRLLISRESAIAAQEKDPRWQKHSA